MKCFSEMARIPLNHTQDDIRSYPETRLAVILTLIQWTTNCGRGTMRTIPEKISEV